jgi:predicted secreted protein|tara:strand:+ start:264 stop:653 length:390 start_codon:yes stop_codon:yes gene_type:complete
MATHKGSSGLVKNGSNTVAEVRTWTLNTNADTIEDTAMGDSARTYLAGLTSADASVDVFWDETDTNGQVALAPGSSVTLVLYPEGADSGDTYYTGTALVTSKSITGSFDGMVEASISATYSGAVTTATV